MFLWGCFYGGVVEFYGVVLDGRRSDVVLVGVVHCSTEWYCVVRSSTGVVLCSTEQYWMDVVLTSFRSE